MGAGESGGLVVIATELHAAARIDRQLHGRAARQGDAGEVQPWASLEDELALRFVPALIRRGLGQALGARLRGAESVARFVLRLAQRRAERQSYQQRLSVLRRDAWLRDSLGAES